MDCKTDSKCPVVFSMGDPHGVGPEILLKALAEVPVGSIRPYIAGDPSFLKALAVDLGLKAGLEGARFIDTGSFPYPPSWGKLDGQAGEYALRSLTRAVEYCRDQSLPVLVTAPINKKAAQEAGMDTPGQTEFVASFYPHSQPAMAFFSEKFHVLLITVHIPLRDVFTQLTARIIVRKGLLFHRVLSSLGGESPRIAVCGLNPHASEEGLFGNEEAEIIEPAIEELNRTVQSNDFSGPFPADTVFKLALERRFDGVVSLYHDQGLAPLKVIAFDSAVNATLGLPIVRVSPAHGTAFDIAGQGQADPKSMIAAIRWATRLARVRQPY